MPGIRLAIREDARADDVASVVRSIDELYRINLWTNRNSLDSDSSRLALRRNATWRSVQPLRLNRVSQGSSVLDFLTPESLLQLLLAAKAAQWTVAFVRSTVAAARDTEGLRHDRARNQRDEMLQDREIIAKDLAIREAELRVQRMESGERTSRVQDALVPTRLERAEKELVKRVDRTPRGSELQELIVRSPTENEDDYVREVRALTVATRAAARLESIEAERHVIDHVDYLE